MRAPTALLAVAAALLVAACGGRSAAPAPTAPERAPAIAPRAVASAGGVAAATVERALVHQRNGAATAATCRPATGAERERAPFGHTRRPLFACTITLRGEAARFDVQVLGNGCFVAERRRPGRAVYGCGAG